MDKSNLFKVDFKAKAGQRVAGKGSSCHKVATAEFLLYRSSYRAAFTVAGIISIAALVQTDRVSPAQNTSSAMACPNSSGSGGTFGADAADRRLDQRGLRGSPDLSGQRTALRF